jgi:hypothetical protein
MSANPNWQEIQDTLLPGQTAADHPDLVSHVIALKKAHLLKLITKDGILGRTIAQVHTIEFQKRGLPHMHLLIWFKDEDRPRTPEDGDSFISPVFPDAAIHPRLYKLVSELMTHGPCGTDNPNASCMVNNHCSNHFSEEFCETTTVNDNGYLKCKCPNDGKRHNI